MDAPETAIRGADRSDEHPVCVVTPGVTFEMSTDVTGAREVCADVSGMRVRVEVQPFERRVQVIFGSLHGSFLVLWMSDPAEIAEIGHTLAEVGEQLAAELAHPGAEHG